MLLQTGVVSQFGQQRPTLRLPAIGSFHAPVIHQIKVATRTMDVAKQKAEAGVLAGIVPLGVEFDEEARVEGEVESGSHDISLKLLIIHTDLVTIIA